MTQIKRKILKMLIIIFLKSTYVYAENKNELSIGIAVGNGIMENVKGMHGPTENNPGTNVKGLVLDDDSLNTIYSLSIDYNKSLNDNLYINSGIAFARH